MKRMILSVVLAIGMLIVAAGCAEQESRKAAAQWIGKDRADLDRAMGAPRESVPLTDTGGVMLVYTYQGHHYVFETSPQGVITSAVESNPQ